MKGNLLLNEGSEESLVTCKDKKNQLYRYRGSENIEQKRVLLRKFRYLDSATFSFIFYTPNGA